MPNPLVLPARRSTKGVGWECFAKQNVSKDADFYLFQNLFLAYICQPRIIKKKGNDLNTVYVTLKQARFLLKPAINK